MSSVLNSVTFNGQIYQKQKGLMVRSWNKIRTVPLIVTYYLAKFGDVMWSCFWVIPKIASANLCKSFHDIINYLTSICPFESGKCGKEGKKSQKFEYLKNEKSFLDEHSMSSYWALKLFSRSFSKYHEKCLPF